MNGTKISPNVYYHGVYQGSWEVSTIKSITIEEYMAAGLGLDSVTADSERDQRFLAQVYSTNLYSFVYLDEVGKYRIDYKGCSWEWT